MDPLTLYTGFWDKCKYMMRFCHQNLSELSFLKLSNKLGAELEGENHLAGHYSFLTAKVFVEIKKVFDQMKEKDTGVLYSAEMHCMQWWSQDFKTQAQNI